MLQISQQKIQLMNSTKEQRKEEVLCRNTNINIVIFYAISKYFHKTSFFYSYVEYQHEGKMNCALVKLQAQQALACNARMY